MLASGTLCVSVFILHLHHKQEVNPPPSWILKMVCHNKISKVKNIETSAAQFSKEDVNGPMMITEHKDQFGYKVLCDINDKLQEMKTVYLNAEKQSHIENQWKIVAHKLDRQLFYIFLSLQILASLILIVMVR